MLPHPFVVEMAPARLAGHLSSTAGRTQGARSSRVGGRGVLPRLTEPKHPHLRRPR